LICGAIDAKFAGMLIEFLIKQEVDRTLFLEEVLWRGFTTTNNKFRSCLQKEGLTNLLLATECLIEVQNRSTISEIDKLLLESLQDELENESLENCLSLDRTARHSFTPQAANFILNAVASTWRDDVQVLSWLKKNLLTLKESYVPAAAIQIMAKGWKDNPETLNTLHEIINQSMPSTPAMKFASVREIARNWNNHSNTLILLKNLAKNFETPNLQQPALQELSRRWKEDDDTLSLLKLCAQSENCFFGVRSEAITEIANGWAKAPWVFEFLCDRAVDDPFVRKHESNRNPRLRAINALRTHYPTHPKTIELLRDRAINDPDEQLRQWAQEQLEMQV